MRRSPISPTVINAGNLASVSLTAGFTYSKNETSVSTSTPVLPTIIGQLGRYLDQ